MAGALHPFQARNQGGQGGPCPPPPLNPNACRPSEKNSQGEIVQWLCLPNRSIKWTFYEKLSFYGLSSGTQICQKWTKLGSSRRSPGSLVGWRGGHSLPISYLLGAPRFSRLRRFDPRAPPWKPGAPAALELAIRS